MKRTSLIVVAALLALVLSLKTSEAANGTVSADIEVRTTAIVVCTISSWDLAFPNYSVNGLVDVTTQANIGVDCASGTPYKIYVSQGLNPDVDGSRRMLHSGGSVFLDYEIYTDSGYTNVFAPNGDGDVSTYIPGTGQGIGQGYWMYGKIVAGQDIPIGDYTDTVAVTVEW